MGLGDALRAFFSRRANPSLRELEAFARERKGVEGYTEPRTATQPVTLLLVDRDGNHRRGAVRELDDAVRFCESLGVPVYDAAVVGYPKRMRGYDERRRRPQEGDLDKRFDEIKRRLEGGSP